jgi:hypothetical protein
MNSESYKFYIGRNAMFGSQDLKTDKFIFKTKDPKSPIGIGGDFEGPFRSIHELTVKSQFYKELKEANSRTAAKLIYPENVNEVQRFLLTPKGKKFEMDLYFFLQHTLMAEFKNGDVSGSHFYNPKNTRILKIHRRNSRGVLDADILRLDYETGNWYPKRATLFPKHWDEGNILAELESAHLRRFPIPNTRNKFGAITLSGVKVIFAYVNGKPKTVYPII